jgi:hypothetical protein
MAHKKRLFGNAALSVLGICLGGMLHASDPEAGLKTSVQLLRTSLTRLRHASAEVTQRRRNDIQNQIAATYSSFVRIVGNLSQNQRVSYLAQIAEITEELNQY